MNKKQFDVLNYISENKALDLDEAARVMFESREKIEQMDFDLNEERYLKKDNITEK